MSLKDLLILLGLLGMICASEDEQCCNLIPNKLWHVSDKKCVAGCNKYSFDKKNCLGATARTNGKHVGSGSVMSSADWAPGCTSAGVWMYFNRETKAAKIQGVTKLYCEQPYKEINMKCESNELYHINQKKCVPGCDEYEFNEAICRRRAPTRWGRSRVNIKCGWAPGCTSAGVWTYFNTNRQAKFIQGVTKLYCKRKTTTQCGKTISCRWNQLYHVGYKKCVPGCDEYEFNEAVCKQKSPKAWGGGSKTNTECNWAPGCTSAGVWTYFNSNQQAKFTQGVIKLYCKRPYSG